MTKQKCPYCGKEFKLLTAHLKRKTPCITITTTSTSMDTFVDLYNFLQTYTGDNIFEWLKDSWEGKDKQESLLRLFAGLGLIQKLQNYDVCKGNFNLKTITKLSNFKDIFYNNLNEVIYLKDKGDSSDLTGISKIDNKNILVTTSKNLNKNNVGKLDIDKILTNFKQYDGFTMTLCICIRNIPDFLIMKSGIEVSNKELKFYIDKDDTIIIDWNDLNQAYHQFKLIFNNPITDIIKSNKKPLCLKMHQHLSVIKTLNLKNNQLKKKALWGHIPRSGKGYIIAGTIIQDSINKKDCNYFIVTTAPNETIEQQLNILNCIQLNDFNIIVLQGNNKNPILKNRNIILCSKQYLQTKIEKKVISWLKKLKFDIQFNDESHNGGSTDLAQQALEFYGKDAFSIQITATYSKPINDYNIPKDSWILWDLEDIKLCKNINIEANLDRLVRKHGDDIRIIIEKYSKENIIIEYSKYPELCLLTDELKPEIYKEIIDKTKDNCYGWSTDACFLLKQGVSDKEVIMAEEFQNEKETLKLWYRIFGKNDKFGIPDPEYPDSTVFMKRIETICKNPLINSRFMGEKEFANEPMIIMAFLPQNNIDKISRATINLLNKNNVIPNYEIISINSVTTNDPKQTIENARIKARNSNKKGVLVLSGKQCSLGVSIDNCDIVLLLNNTMSFDMIFQMMYRCMTEGLNKKCGFVVDLNINRVIQNSIIDYASLIKPDNHLKDGITYILQERLINLNGDHWMPEFGNDINKLTKACNDIYEIYLSNAEIALSHFLTRLRFKEVLLTKEEQKIFNSLFSKITPSKQQKELIDAIIEDETDDEVNETIKIGIEKISTDISGGNDDRTDVSNDKKNINYIDILKHIIPLICLLTIHNNETSFVEMFEMISNNKYIYDILIDQTQSWWGKNIDTRVLKKFINIYVKYMKDDKETNQIIRTIKELFVKNLNNSKQLSQIIDKYLIPQEFEKKNNAEITTPFKLRQDMLDTIDKSFWKTTNKIFEPCAGKGGFLLDIIDRFMLALIEPIPDEKIRYKTIVENCIYFNDINSTNIFICKLLIDPYNEYNLNFNEGNTLDINIKNKWGIDGFNAIIGNPPYNKGKNANFYVDFMKFAFDNLLEDGLNLFVVPNRFIIPKHKSNQCLNMFQVKYIMHTVKEFNVATDIGYYLAVKSKIVDNQNILCIFNTNKEYYINLNIPTPTANNSLEYKTLSDKILNNSFDKIKFIKSKKEDIDNDCHIFIPRHWTRFATSKPKGGSHVFNIVNEYGDDGRFIKVNDITRDNIIWYLTRSKIIRFITNNYASTVFIPPFIWDNIPAIDFNVKYTDHQIYDIFNLSEAEKILIEKVVD